jgi:hypothetical protein
VARRAVDPWRDAPTSELGDQILPRWFVLLAVATVGLAVVAAVVAFFAFGPTEVPPAARRPPPAEGYTTAVGDLRVGETDPVPLAPAACPELEGIRVAGSPSDQRVLAEGLAPLCDIDVPAPLGDFASAGGVVRFAQFSNADVDSTARIGEPLILLNNRLAVTDPAWIAPLVVHDLVMLAGDPASAETAVAAIRAQAAACDAVIPQGTRSRACDDAAAVLALDDPLAALSEAGYSRAGAVLPASAIA